MQSTIRSLVLLQVTMREAITEYRGFRLLVYIRVCSTSFAQYVASRANRRCGGKTTNSNAKSSSLRNTFLKEMVVTQVAAYFIFYFYLPRANDDLCPPVSTLECLANALLRDAEKKANLVVRPNLSICCCFLQNMFCRDPSGSVSRSLHWRRTAFTSPRNTLNTAREVLATNGVEATVSYVRTRPCFTYFHQ